jgi:uncharacterized protein YcbK (DUF882 family)
MQLTTNFNVVEFMCKDGTPVPEKYICNVQTLASNLQVLRDYLGEPVKLNSGYRTESYNKKVGGKPASKHLIAQAADITVKSKTPKQLAAIIEKLISEKKMKQGGLGVYPGFVHYDVRGTKARW